MLQLIGGKIILNGSECHNPELLFFTLKDLSETNEFELTTKLSKVSCQCNKE